LVEDDDEQRFALKEQLSQAGYKVTVALDDASMAWSLQFCHYDAVVVDLGTPDSLLLEVLAEVHERDPLRSLMIISGGNEHQQRVARSIGAHLVEGTSESVDALGRLLLG
jgi:DNA-binding response OmpR family regulator